MNVSFSRKRTFVQARINEIERQLTANTGPLVNADSGWLTPVPTA
jgi:hypothetical protein